MSLICYDQLMKHKRLRLVLYSVISCVIIALAATSTFFVIKHADADISPSVSPSTGLAQKTPGTPQFSFMAAKAPGWHQGPTDKVSMALFSNDMASGCWTSIEHKTGTIDEAAELQKIQAHWTDSGYTVAPSEPLAVTLQTKTAPLSYNLHQYTVASTTGEQVLGGQEFAYFPVPSGYIKVQGYCNSASQLATITPALEALVFDASKS